MTNNSRFWKIISLANIEQQKEKIDPENKHEKVSSLRVSFNTNKSKKRFERISDIMLI
jgi:hypothetical protein